MNRGFTETVIKRCRIMSSEIIWN